jgi:hypothetical protein
VTLMITKLSGLHNCDGDRVQVLDSTEAMARTVGSEEDREVAREIARESITLLVGP